MAAKYIYIVTSELQTTCPMTFNPCAGRMHSVVCPETAVGTEKLMAAGNEPHKTPNTNSSQTNTSSKFVCNDLNLKTERGGWVRKPATPPRNTVVQWPNGMSHFQPTEFDYFTIPIHNLISRILEAERRTSASEIRRPKVTQIILHGATYSKCLESY